MPRVQSKVTETAGAALGIALDTTPVTVFTGSASLKDPSGQASGYGGQIKVIQVSNSHTGNRLVKIYLVSSGGSVSEATKIFEETLATKEIVRITPKCPYEYKDSATVQGTQDAGTDVFVKVSASEFV
jgi:hypothetical protein